jgi:hypothetical protein
VAERQLHARKQQQDGSHTRSARNTADQLGGASWSSAATPPGGAGCFPPRGSRPDGRGGTFRDQQRALLVRQQPCERYLRRSGTELSGDGGHREVVGHTGHAREPADPSGKNGTQRCRARGTAPAQVRRSRRGGRRCSAGTSSSQATFRYQPGARPDNATGRSHRGIEVRGRAELHGEGGEKFGTGWDRAWLTIRPKRVISWGINGPAFSSEGRSARTVGDR